MYLLCINVGLYSAVLLLCTLEGNVEEHPPECTTMIHAKPFQTLKQCVKSSDAYEIKHGKMWAEANVYLISSVCINWRNQTNYQFLRGK